MRVLKQSLLAVVAVFAVAPAAAFALPSPQCYQICPYGGPAACSTECYERLTATTCGDAGYYCTEGVAPTVSAPEAAAQPAEDAPVCSAEHPAEVQPATVES